MNRKILAFAFCLLTLIPFCIAGCKGTSESNAFNYYYNKVKLGMTMDEVGEATGLKAQADADNTYIYKDAAGKGVCVYYTGDKRAFGMDILIIKPATDVAPLMKSPFTKEQYDKIKAGMSHEDVVNLLGGDGVEIGIMASESDCTGAARRYFMWSNQDGSQLDISFSSDDTVRKATYYN